MNAPDGMDRALTAPPLADLALALLAALLPDPADPAPAARLLRDRRGTLPAAAVPALLAAGLAAARGPDARLARLAAELELDATELLAAALALAVETEPLAAAAVAHLQAPLPHARPTLGLLAQAFLPLGGAAPRLVASLAGGAAIRAGLMELGDETAPLAERPLHLAVPLVPALLGLPPRLDGLRLLPPAEPPLPPSLRRALERRAHALARGPRRALLLRARDPLDGSAAAATLARTLDRRALLITAGATAPHGTGPMAPGPRCLGPLCRLLGALPVLRLDLAPGERPELAWPAGWDGPLLLLAGVDGSVECPEAALLAWALPLPTAAERARAWQRHGVAADLARSLGRELRQGPARIAAVGATAGLISELAGRRRPDVRALERAADETARGLLEALAQPVPALRDERAFVAPSGLAARLDLLLARCRARDGLADGLGPALVARYEPGVRALFSGPSGTGKTLAAAWLAGRLGLPLWRVDLAAITSKWIGETEKNLSVLLARAEAADVVLLFDEADALFGRRTDIKDSNDRFANAQTNWLLQRIETYEGIVLLTSNSRARFDPAFARRLDLIVEFDPPAMAERRGLWRAHLGAALDPRALDRLAALPDLTGGQIRSAVLTAAALARSRAGPMALADLGRAVAAEYTKQGHPLPPELTPLLTALREPER